MNAALRAEWLKLTTTKPFRWLLYGAGTVGVLVAFIGTAQGPPPWHVSQPLREGTAWSLGTLSVTVLAMVIGSRTVTEEFAYDSVVHTFIADPDRRRTMLAKAAIAALASGLVAAVTAVAIGVTTYGMAAATGGNRIVFQSDGQALVGLLAAAAAMGVMGVGVGAIARHPVPALVGVLLWLFVAENLVGLIAGPVAGFLPGKLATALAGVPQAAAAAPVTVAAGATAAYAAVLLAAGGLQMRRRDVL